MDAIAKNNRDVDSNPRGVLGSCVDAGLGAGCLLQPHGVAIPGELPAELAAG